MAFLKGSRSSFGKSLLKRPTTMTRTLQISNPQQAVEATTHCITLDHVQQAAKRIEGMVHRTPVMTSQGIAQLAKRENVFFKMEALQRTGSFKFRGALNAIRGILESYADAPPPAVLTVVTHSSGNHGQALTLAAKLSSTDQTKVSATVVLPRVTPQVKKAAAQAFGARIEMVANTNEARSARAAELVATIPNSVFVHTSHDPRIIAGQGTACLEMLEQIKELDNKELDLVIIPVGGGGLASGSAICLRGLLGDRVKIVLAEPAKLDDAKRSFDAGEWLNHAPDNDLDSVADGLKTTLGSKTTWPIVRDLVDDIWTVSETEILAATKLVWERLKVCVEPNGAVAAAVLLSHAFQSAYPPNQYPNVACILSGGNVDVIKIAKKMQEAGLE